MSGYEVNGGASSGAVRAAPLLRWLRRLTVLAAGIAGCWLIGSLDRAGSANAVELSAAPLPAVQSPSSAGSGAALLPPLDGGQSAGPIDRVIDTVTGLVTNALQPIVPSAPAPAPTPLPPTPTPISGSSVPGSDTSMTLGSRPGTATASHPGRPGSIGAPERPAPVPQALPGARPVAPNSSYPASPPRIGFAGPALDPRTDRPTGAAAGLSSSEALTAQAWPLASCWCGGTSDWNGQLGAPDLLAVQAQDARSAPDLSFAVGPQPRPTAPPELAFPRAVPPD